MKIRGIENGKFNAGLLTWPLNPRMEPECVIASGIQLPRHQADSPPRNDLATNVLATKRSLLATNHQ